MTSLFDPKEEEVTTTSTSGPPAWAQPYVEDYVGGLEGIRNTQLSPYGGNLYAPMSSTRREGLTGAADFARAGGTGLGGASADYLNDVLSGKYLESPQLAEAAQGSIDRMTPEVYSQFALGGRSGSGLAAEAYGEGVTRELSDAYFRERGLQQGAAALAPSIDALGYKPYDVLTGVGSAYEMEDQNRINEDLYRHEFNQDEPYTRMSRYGNLLGLGSNMWGSEGSNTQTMYGPSPFQSIAGLGMTAAGMMGGMPMPFSFGAGAPTSYAPPTSLWNSLGY